MSETDGTATFPTERVRPVADDLEATFARLRPSLLRICSSLVGPDEAEDVVHDTYLRASSRLSQLRDVGLADAWLIRIAVNLCYGRHRRRRGLVESLRRTEPRQSADGDLGLRELIEQLPLRERTVIVLHYGHGYRLDEIADLLTMNHATIRSIAARTRRRLHRAITEAER